jgi:hypothetical protein
VASVVSLFSVNGSPATTAVDAVACMFCPGVAVGSTRTTIVKVRADVDPKVAEVTDTVPVPPTGGKLGVSCPGPSYDRNVVETGTGNSSKTLRAVVVP